MQLSIVTTLYKSALTVEAFYRRAVTAAEALTTDFEIVLVDDGSPDDSLQIALSIVERDARVRVVELSRNFGHHKALITGLEHARGDLSFLIDSDLEEEPELLQSFLEKLKTDELDVVYGYQIGRKGGFLERITGKIAYKLFDVFIPYQIPHNHITVRLMRREYVEALLQHREQQTVIGGLWVITGFRQIGVPVNKLVRTGTTYGYWRRWIVLIDSIASFSETPLVAIFYLGIIISTLSALIGIGLMIHKFIFRGAVEGWVSVMLSVWFLGGLLIFCIGVIGIYISKIFIETKNRPYTIVRRMHVSNSDPPNHLGAMDALSSRLENSNTTRPELTG
jgi:putative glycosyltransferase